MNVVATDYRKIKFEKPEPYSCLEAISFEVINGEE